MSSGQTEIRRKKLLHRARYRGFKEADILIGGFAEDALSDMTERDLDAFEAILEASDHEIYAWVSANASPPDEIDPGLIERMRAFDAAAKIRRG